MIPIVSSAARVDVPRPDSTKGAAAALPRKVLRETKDLVIGNTPSLPRRGCLWQWKKVRSDVGGSRLGRDRCDHRFPLAFGLGSRSTFAGSAPSRPSA